MLKLNTYFLLQQAGAEETATESSSTVVDNPAETQTPAAVETTSGGSLSDLVTDDAAKEFLGKSTYDANAIVKMAMEGQKATTPASAFSIGDISDRLSKEHKMEPEAIKSFLGDDNFMKSVLADVRNAKASQSVADNFLVGAIKDMHETEKVLLNK